ncbi:4152_t:CDS:2, partial [Gigaspora margarita]
LINQDESNEDSQLPETSDESVSEYIGRPEDPINDEYIKLGTRDKHGHVAMKCKYCEDTTQRGRPSEMKSHLALECKHIKIKKKLINYALTCFFACCGIPFWVVESAFFIDFLKNLNVVNIDEQLKRIENLTL